MDPRLVSSPLDSGATSALPPRAAALLPGPGQLLAERRAAPFAGALGWEFLAENACGAGRIREAARTTR